MKMLVSKRNKLKGAEFEFFWHQPIEASSLTRVTVDVDGPAQLQSFYNLLSMHMFRSASDYPTPLT